MATIMRYIPYDDYHSRVVLGTIMGVVTTQWGNPALRHGWKVITINDLHMSDYNEIELKPDSKVTPLGDCRFDIDGREIEFRIRKLTPRECFRLMDVSEEDIDRIQASGVSNSQQYKMAGNSIVVACLAAIFRQMLTPTDNAQQPQQLTLF